MNNSLRNPWQPSFGGLAPFGFNGGTTPAFSRSGYKRNKKGTNLKDSELS